MALHKLPANAVIRITESGMHNDGGGLYLNNASDTARSWTLRFTSPVHKRVRDMGLGSVEEVSMAEAREKAAAARKLVAQGIDPIDARAATREAGKLAAARSVTFSQCAEAYIASYRAGWSSPKHAGQWKATLATYADPVIGKLPVQTVDTPVVLEILRPIWPRMPETAKRVRGRIEAILDFARVSGYRPADSENPARWRGHLDKLLPARAKVRPVKHHAALPYPEMPAFMTELRKQSAVAALCLQFVILTAARTGEAIAMTWNEINPAGRVWTVPAERMKGRREHRVPLSNAAVDVLEAARIVRRNEYIFPAGNARGEHLSNMAMLVLLGRMGRGDLTVHGFRSTFRDWASECTDHNSNVVEMALAHVLGNKVEAAYRRGDLFEKRRNLMADWGDYCGASVDIESDKVVTLKR